MQHRTSQISHENRVLGHAKCTGFYSDSAVQTSITPLKVTLDNKQEFDFYEKLHSSALRLRSDFDDSDYRLRDNLWAIRELPMRIKVRNTNLYFTVDGKRSEVTLSRVDDPSKVEDSFRHLEFYIQRFAPSTGFKTLIYSRRTSTPLGVGYYTNNEDENILYALAQTPENASDLFQITWDLLPVKHFKGYFGIECQFCFGYTDPNNRWTQYRKVLEIRNDKIRYGRYDHKPQQEFLLELRRKFKLDYIEFKEQGAKLELQEPLKVVSYGVNKAPEYKSVTVSSVNYIDDTYRFDERSALIVPLANPTELFYRPIVAGRKIQLPNPVNPKDESKPIRNEPDMKYSASFQRLRHKLAIDIDLIAKPNSAIEVTSYLENYKLTVDYTAHLIYVDSENKERRIKLDGTWYGTIFTTKRDSRYPKDIPKFRSLEDGEEL